MPVLIQALKCQNPLCMYNDHEFFIYAYTYYRGHDSVVSIVTYFGLDSSGFEFQWRKEIFSSTYWSRPVLGPHGVLLNEYQGSFIGEK